ncbi:trichohyalin [Drosophila busckii]|uniref:trichohyalin n=1 Tax=Drosophila busckii TaxID=30019 RepID=UPI00083F4BA8|nr:trichohyalin [Drosophila busckii]
MELRRSRRRRMEPARIQYGAWDDPRISIFATVPQEPIPDMLGLLKRVQPGTHSNNLDMDACPLVLATSQSTNVMYREVKHQVQQIADDRNRNYHPRQERERQSAMVARMLAEHKRRDFVEAMRRRQLVANSPKLRELKIEIERAKTTLSIVQKRNDNEKQHGTERAQERAEALEHREQVRMEKEAEQRALKQKTKDYSDQLVDQIRQLRQQRDQQHHSELEEGRQKRRGDEQQQLADLKHALECRHKNRTELKQMLDDFAALQRSLRQGSGLQQDKLDVIVMEALGPHTAGVIKQELQRRQQRIERRGKVSSLLAQELSEIKRKKDAHESMLTDILACERQAREKKRAYEEVQKRRNQKVQVAKDLLGQHEEQQFYRARADALGKQVIIDKTSFMQRQYKMTEQMDRARREINIRTYEANDADIVNNARLRAAELEEQRQLKQHLMDLESDLERRIDEERMRVLHEQPRTVLVELRPTKLTEAELKEFNLPSTT